MSTRGKQMRFFNLDLHIGVIGDIKQVFRSLGHEVTDWSMSAHTWILGRPVDKIDVVNENTWKAIGPEMCDAFYERYRDELALYDGFIVTHTPCFAMLYEKWKKPVICVASTRYEHPFSHDRAAWEKLNEFLRRQIDDGLIIPVANNKYDADYAEYFTQRSWRVIPSICDYTNAPYTGTRQESLYYSKLKQVPSGCNLLSRAQLTKRSLMTRIARRLGIQLGSLGYSWSDLSEFRSVVYIPYNASIMSIFEMYTCGIPMLFPSEEFARKLYISHKKDGVFSELSYNQVRGLPSGSVIASASTDPNNFEDDQLMSHWIAKSDFYDADNLRHLVYFDSFEELPSLLKTLDPQEIHRKMMAHSQVRKARVYSAWAEVLDKVAEIAGCRKALA